MKYVLLLQGPNMNRLGIGRPQQYYGARTLDDVHAEFEKYATDLGVRSEHFQSNHEGALIDWLQERQDEADAIIANPSGLTFYGDSFRQALLETGKPIGIVHMSQLHARGDITSKPWRQHDLYADIATIYTAGLGWRGYTIALQALYDRAVEGTTTI